MIDFLIGALFLVVILYVVKLVMNMINIPENIKQIAWIIIGLIVLMIVLQWFGIYDIDLGSRR